MLFILYKVPQCSGSSFWRCLQLRWTSRPSRCKAESQCPSRYCPIGGRCTQGWSKESWQLVVLYELWKYLCKFARVAISSSCSTKETIALSSSDRSSFSFCPRARIIRAVESLTIVSPVWSPSFTRLVSSSRHLQSEVFHRREIIKTYFVSSVSANSSGLFKILLGPNTRFFKILLILYDFSLLWKIGRKTGCLQSSFMNIQCKIRGTQY